eukprot:CAMPEP_0117694726 /NCGR_PEP_ID=MMETSP0804-20121206/27655_1 /TAXON_ID=1074897 /ORGANISM="Tetraselmis astigmatica, Strain CCMP880" /LENGTH=92 /DNA_ID=CAMNT_0005508541 /DNA_START=217 /DNA_END=495 /DNA_ORIENTATION=-
MANCGERPELSGAALVGIALCAAWIGATILGLAGSSHVAGEDVLDGSSASNSSLIANPVAMFAALQEPISSFLTPSVVGPRSGIAPPVPRKG